MDNDSLNSIRKNLASGNNKHVTRSIRRRNFGEILTKISLVGAAIIILASGAYAGTYYLKSPFQKSYAENVSQNKSILKEENYFKNERKAKARDYVKTGGLRDFAGGAAGLKVKMVTTKTGFDAIDSELHEHCTKRFRRAISSDAEKSGVAYFSMKDASKFLTCTAKIQRSRFCSSYYRSRFAKRVKEFLTNREEIVTAVKMTGNTRMGETFSKLDRNMDTINSVNKLLGVKEAKLRRNKKLPKPGMPRDLGNQISQLSELGLLSLSDFKSFFFGIPDGIEPYVKEAKKDVCS